MRKWVWVTLPQLFGFNFCRWLARAQVPPRCFLGVRVLKSLRACSCSLGETSTLCPTRSSSTRKRGGSTCALYKSIKGRVGHVGRLIKSVPQWAELDAPYQHGVPGKTRRVIYARQHAFSGGHAAFGAHGIKHSVSLLTYPSRRLG